MKISKNKVVSINYTLTNDAGDVLDTSSGRDPLAYIHGTGALIPGLESELENKTKGEKLKAVIAPEEAYGVRNEKLVMSVPKANFQGDEPLEIGMQISVRTNQGSSVATVTDIDNNDNVTLDMNHPLAGETLHFDVEVMSVREATAEEISHGHVHGPGGHHH
jgi:FKBP-type peptidyl-prolyl cis-trans isomerase SlyD